MNFYLCFEGRTYDITCNSWEKGKDVRKAFAKRTFKKLDDYLLVYDKKVLQDNQDINGIADCTDFNLVNKKQKVIIENDTIEITLDDAGEVTVKDLRAIVEAKAPGRKVSYFTIKFNEVRDDSVKVGWFDIYHSSGEARLYVTFESLVEITFVNAMNESIKVKLDENSSIKEAKEAIAKAVNIPVDELRLVKPPETGEKIGAEIEDTYRFSYLKNRSIAAVKNTQQVLFVTLSYDGKEGELMPFVFYPYEPISNVKARMSSQLFKTGPSNAVLELTLGGLFLSDTEIAKSNLRDGSVVVLHVAQKKIEQPKATTPTSPVTSQQSKDQREHPSQQRVPVGYNQSSMPPSHERVPVSPPPNTDSKCLQNAALIGCVTIGVCLFASHSVRFFIGADRASPKVLNLTSLAIGALTGAAAYIYQSDGQSGAQRD